ncbi:hypothetical protein BWI15_16270 [Kribbella sp. ALI-6-A]|nr:hypothetical protein BWI15_16270 [Kribbella sp. ALI-6-A]
MISECSTSIAVLDDVCSFRGLKSSDYLDLDWAPTLLMQAAMIARVDAKLLAALTRATRGEGELNPAYRDMPETIWEHPVSSLSSTQVAEIDKSLQVLAGLDFPSAHDAFGRLPQFERMDRPAAYLCEHFRALCDFYRGAAERGFGTIMWWD